MSRKLVDALEEFILPHVFIFIFVVTGFALMGSPMVGVYLYLFFMAAWIILTIIATMTFFTISIPFIIPWALWTSKKENKKAQKQFEYDELIEKSQGGFVAHPEKIDTYILGGYDYHKKEIEDDPILNNLWRKVGILK
tara:strand:- start:186 stop:599 length:414 start_codon:yes stop_codon:yes gene_type:complete